MTKHHILFPEGQYKKRIAEVKASRLDQSAKKRTVNAIENVRRLFVIELPYGTHRKINEKALLPNGYRLSDDILPSNRVFLEIWDFCKVHRRKIAKKDAIPKINTLLGVIGRIDCAPEDNADWFVECLKKQRKIFIRLDKSKRGGSKGKSRKRGGSKGKSHKRP